MNRPRSPLELEDDLDVEMAHLEAITVGGYSPKVNSEVIGFDRLAENAAMAEADWKIRVATAKVNLADRDSGGKREAEHMMDARILAQNPDLYRTYKLTAAAKEAGLEAVRTCRSRVDAIRTKNANRRGQD